MRSFLTRILPELIRINISLSVTLSAFAAWVVASGTVSVKSVIPLAGIFLLACGASVLNQIPYFWLLMLKYGDEYRSAGFPVMTDIFNSYQFRNIIFAWMIGATGTSLLLVLSGFWMFFLSETMIMGINLLILSLFFYQLYFAKNLRYRLMFITMNAFMLLVLSLIIVEKLFP